MDILRWVTSVNPTMEQKHYLTLLSKSDNINFAFRALKDLFNESFIINEYQFFKTSFLAKDIFGNEISLYKKGKQYILHIGMNIFRARNLGNIFWKIRNYVKGAVVEINKLHLEEMYEKIKESLDKIYPIRDKHIFSYEKGTYRITMVDIGRVTITKGKFVTFDLLERLPDNVKEIVMDIFVEYVKKLVNVKPEKVNVFYLKRNVLGYDDPNPMETYKFALKVAIYYNILKQVEQVKKLIIEKFQSLSNEKIIKIKQMIYSQFARYPFAIKELMEVYNNELSKRESTL